MLSRVLSISLQGDEGLSSTQLREEDSSRACVRPEPALT